jgi:hypothetical protein
VPDPHAAAVGEVDHLGRRAEPEHVRRQHPVPLGERGNNSLPGCFGIHAELAAVQQHHRLAGPSLQIVGGEPVDGDGAALKAHQRVT